MLFGALVGSFLAGEMAGRIGRRMTAIIATGICLFGGLTPAFSVDLPMFMILRFILGFGVGVIGVICPLYVSEVVPQHKRGVYGVVFQLTLTFGILISYIVGYVLTSLNISSQSLKWRIMIASFGTLLPVILMIVIVIGMKETSRMRPEETPLQNQESFEISSRGGWMGLFVSGRFFSQTLTGIILAVTLQLTGVNAIMYFGTDILKKALPNSDSSLLNIGIGAWNFLATFISLFLVSRLERRSLMTGSTVLIAYHL
jgi:MFS family permease